MGLMSFAKPSPPITRKEIRHPIKAENVVVGPGAKCSSNSSAKRSLTRRFCTGVQSAFPTYAGTLIACGVSVTFHSAGERISPHLRDIEDFVKQPKAKAIFLNSPNNPTGGVATESDLKAIADLVRGKNIAVFSDEPYNHMVWSGKHHPLLAQPGILDQAVACYTFSKSYSMSGWRLGYAVSSPRIVDAIGKMINTSLSCVPPIVQLAGEAALKHDASERDEVMQRFKKKVELLVSELKKVEGVNVIMPAGTFYVFPNVEPICKKLGITSHGLAMFLLEAADDQRGVACLGGECFGPRGRASCASVARNRMSGWCRRWRSLRRQLHVTNELLVTWNRIQSIGFNESLQLALRRRHWRL